MRAGLPLTVLTCGLLITLAGIWIAHPAWQKWENWGALQTWWLAGFVVSLAAGLALWLFRRWSLMQSARRIDERLHSLNRLETATEFSTFDDPLVRAQREETAEFLRHAPVQKRLRRFPWLVLAIALLTLGHLTTLLLWTRPWIRPVIAEKKAEPPAPLPKAAIKWKSPKAETKAAPIEEVPLEASADSASGLRALFLEVSVNGEPKLSATVVVADLNKPGARTIQTSLYLDQLEVQPYDMIAYYLRARRVVAATEKREVPETVSPVQFVQVKPFRDDVREEVAGGGMPGEDAESILRLIKAMKVAQLRLIKENFMLTHAEIAHDQPEWRQENARVGSEQGVLEKKAGEVLQLMIEKGAPAEMVNLITQAQPLIGDASKKIAATQNQPALPVQQKALALITEIEKFLIKAIQRSQGEGKPKPDIKDPFEKQRDVELKQRAETQAGELELLAREQARLADDLAKNSTASDAPAPGAKPDKNKVTGTPAERQTQISQRVGALLNGENFEPEITGHLEKGRDEARASLRHLDAEDPAAAREPSVAAAHELQLAVTAMQKAGEEKAQQQMEAALQATNQAAKEARGTPNQPSDQQAREAAEQAAKDAEQARRDLAEAAREQQEKGSQDAAERMAQMANALNDPKLRKALQELKDKPRDAARANTAGQRLAEVADRFGKKPGAAAAPTREEISELIERMDRARVNLERLAKQERNGGNDKARMTKDEGSPKPEAPNSGAQNGEHGQTAQSEGETGQQRQQGQQGQGEGPGQPQSASQQGGQAQGGNQTNPNQQARGEGQSQQQGQGGGPGEVQAQEQNQTPGRGSGPGTGSGTGGHGVSQPERLAPGQSGGTRERFAREVLDEIRDVADDGVRLLPNSELLAEASREIQKGMAHWRELPPTGHLQIISRELQMPMQSVIDLLRAELKDTVRQHELTSQRAKEAPAAYREAVADYFERLSKDYEAEEK